MPSSGQTSLAVYYSNVTIGANCPLVSVYVVNRNYGQFLRRAIESVLSQDYPEVEILVVDDASDDCSAEVLAAFERNPRIRILRQPVARGLTACCNTAVSNSSGEFVMRLDADDYLEVSAVSTMAAAIVSEPTAVLVFPDYFEVDERGAFIRRVQRHDLNALDVMSDLPAHGACTVVRRTFLEGIGGYDESISCQDGVDLWLSVAPEQRVLHIGEPLFRYRRHGRNLTRNESALLQARAKLIAKHAAKREVTRPRVLGVVPVRGQAADPESTPLQQLGDRPLIEWTVDEALACEGLDRVVVSSPDKNVLAHISARYGSRVGQNHRSFALAGLNVSVGDSLRQVLHAEAGEGRYYDGLMVLTVESPFRSSIFIQQAIHVMQLFDADGVVGARHEDEEYFRHDGLGLQPVRDDNRLRRERDDLFRSCGGMRWVKLHPDSAAGDLSEYLNGVERDPKRMGHVLLDQRSAFTVRTGLDWAIAQVLVKEAHPTGRS
jgi:CMP-N-acetylneuraminic acid synthetase